MLNKRNNRHYKYRLNWLIHWILALIVSVLFTLTLEPGSISTATSSIVNQSLFISLCCFLLLPDAKNFSHLMVNSSCGILILMLVLQLPDLAEVPVSIFIKICVMMFSLSILLWSLTQLLQEIFPHYSQIRLFLFLLSCLTTATPLWLGSVVDAYQPGNTLTNSIVSITPLTHFSVAAEYDYLRSEWLYRNTPFGSLPFIYPGFIGITTSYILLILSLQTLLWFLVRSTPVLKRMTESPAIPTKQILKEDTTR